MSAPSNADLVGRDRANPSPAERVGAVIAAGGRSARMGGIDKLFAPLAGRPLLYHTLSAFETCDAVRTVVLVVSPENLAPAQALVGEGGFSKVVGVCGGGDTRQASVRAGLEALPASDWVVVHDGARPLVTPALIQAGLEAARPTGAAVCALPAAETVKEADPSARVLRTLDRSGLWLVQTPQVFRCDILRQAHQAAPDADATDDAALVERLGVEVRLYMGSPRNLKVTTHEDLAMAEALLRT